MEENEVNMNATKSSKKQYVKEYTFSNLFDIYSANTDVYDRLVKRLVDMAIEGLYSSFFVYGHTGSGKSYTISGDNKGNEGVFQIAIRDILDRQKSIGYEVNMSIYEIYNEHVYDLLSIGSDYNKQLKILEDRDSGVFYIDNLTKHSVSSIEEFRNILNSSNNRRHHANTYLLHTSSRSHYCIQIHILNKIGEKAGLLTFFDLAGCEKFELYNDNTQKMNISEFFSSNRAEKYALYNL